MITFKDFLIESRSAPLYHGTTIKSLIRILELNTIKKNKASAWDDNNTISFSRSKDFARYWSHAMAQDSIDDEPVVIEIDQARLRQRYKLTPYNFFPNKTRRSNLPRDFDKRNEYEERIENRDVTNADQYIKKIIVFEKPGKAIKGNIILSHPLLYYNGKFVNR